MNILENLLNLIRNAKKYPEGMAVPPGYEINLF